jgi:hypothetical protein
VPAGAVYVVGKEVMRSAKMWPTVA